ncbi:MAG: hypothetical protein NWF07_06380 [Candidatus Bathyarchaeota archaeon]|nr:hypothetical protein [Candidatus Bathyarchaeota archaeon]
MSERKPNATDYLASAALSYAIIFFYIRLANTITVPWLLSYVIYFLAGALPTYMVLRKLTRDQFPVAIISSVVNWIFTFVCLITFTQGNQMAFFRMLFVFFVMGGVSVAVITMKARLSPKKKPED